jgi:cytochrome c556
MNITELEFSIRRPAQRIAWKRPDGARYLTGVTALSAIVALLTNACEKSEQEATQAVQSARPTAAATVVEEPRDTPTVQKRMQDHFTWADAMRQAVMEGNLENVRGPARQLAKDDLGEGLHEEWQAHLEDMRAATKMAAEANDIQGAALALSHVGAACGSCHAKLSGPRTKVGAPPGEASGAKAHMQRHAWAAERMWEGLMAPYDDAWTAGAEALIQAPLAKEELVPNQSVPDEIAELARKVHDIGAKGREVMNPDKRVPLYAEFLATCADCHRKMKVSGVSM